MNRQISPPCKSLVCTSFAPSIAPNSHTSVPCLAVFLAVTCLTTPSPAALVFDQIGPLTTAESFDFSTLPDPAPSQLFPDFAGFDAAVLENFTVSSDQLEITGVSVVFRALGGFADFSTLQGYAVNVFSDVNLAATGILGNEAGVFVTGAAVSTSPILDTSGQHEYGLVSLEVTFSLPAAGEYWIGVSSVGDQHTIGQFMVAASPVNLPDSPDARLANPGEGFGVGALSPTGTHHAYALTAVPEPGVTALIGLSTWLLLTRRRPTRSAP